MMKKVFLGFCLLVSIAGLAQIQVLPYQDPVLPAEQRADDLLGRLTLEE